MNPGFILLLLALMLSGASLFFYLKSSDDARMLKAARRTWHLAGAVMLTAMLLLLMFFLMHRFEYAYVYSYSARDLHPAYLVAALWAGQEGSFLLWAMLVSLFGAHVISKNEPDERLIMSALLTVKIALLVMLAVHSPFRYVWEDAASGISAGTVQPDGMGLNALLQDPWMVVHPPALFVGYASAAVPFAYAIAALIRRDFTGWADRARGWVLFSAATLGIGIFLGGYWAYKVLGWGGYWGWDPVENSSLIPWLVILALLHGLVVQKRKGGLVRTNLALALASFILVFYSTFLTRSGVLSDFSVHSFGDLGLSRYLAFFLLFFAAVSAFLYAVRVRAIKGAPLSTDAFAWDTLLSFGLVTLVFYAAFIAVGTSMPIISALFSPKPFSVQQSFYTQISVPMGILVLVFMGLAPLSTFLERTRRWFLAAAGVASIVLATVLNTAHTAELVPYIFTALALMCGILAIKDLATLNAKALLASRGAHLGVAVIVIGFITSSFHSESAQRELVQGKAEKVLGLSLTFKEFREGEKSSLAFTRETAGGAVEFTTPYFIDPRMGRLFKEPAILYGFSYDAYITPVEFRSGAESGSHIQLGKGVEAELEGMKFLFEGFDRDEQMMRAEHPRVQARIRVSYNGRTELLAPSLVMHGDERSPVGARFSSTGQAVTLEDFDIQGQRVLLHVEPLKGAPVRPDSVLVDVSKKRLIWLVWLGTVLITAGCFLAMKKRTA
jgi:cytochrome c-type biogenesis protein CcmF